MKIKHLTRQGNSLAVIIDRPILDLLDIDEKTPLKLSVDGRKILLEPLSKQEILLTEIRDLLRSGVERGPSIDPAR